MLRFLNESKISDKISTKSILDKHNLLSVNQLNAQKKLGDMWKANNIENYPIKVKRLSDAQSAYTTRAQ